MLNTREWNKLNNEREKESIAPTMKGVSEITTSCSFIFPDTQVEFKLIPEPLSEFRIFTCHYFVNMAREKINKDWLRKNNM
jgi:hypothetical protein